MSDTDDFDEEAERERLREQFEDDREERELTSRMSDLLLKGATMTNRHCPECGSPIFSNGERHFCPTCQRPVQVRGSDEEARAQQSEEGQRADQGQQTESTESTESAEERIASERTTGSGGQTPDRPTPDGRRTADSTGDTETEYREIDVEPEAGADRTDTAADGRRAGSTEAPDTTVRPDSASRVRTTGATGSGAPVDLGDAEASLARTLTDQARRAEETGDVGRKRELLSAAREAAEALAATRRARR